MSFINFFILSYPKTFKGMKPAFSFNNVKFMKFGFNLIVATFALLNFPNAITGVLPGTTEQSFGGDCLKRFNIMSSNVFISNTPIHTEN